MPSHKKKYSKPDIVNETGIIRKHWGGRIRIVLIYPNTYYIGMSNLGFQSVYYQLNQIEHIVCERAFYPDEHDFKKGQIRTIESQKSINEFDIIAFSISFESDYIRLVSILKKTGLPLQTNARKSSHPLIIAGGVTCFFNPEPIASFIDCIMIGEAETILTQFFDYYEPSEPKELVLEKISNKMDGIYIPGKYETLYNKNNTVSSFNPVGDAPHPIKRVYTKDLSETPTSSTILTPNTTFNDTYLIEVSRGCPHGCRFCSAGYIYRPPRFRPFETLSKLLEAGASLSNKIGLVGAAVSDLPRLSELCSIAEGKDITISFSSLRAEALTPELVTSLKKSNVKTATIAPDAGSERMRRVINKGITEDHILSATRLLVLNGIPNLKLYFMVGLPTETMEDVLEIVELTKKIKKEFLESSRIKKHIGEIHVSINPYVPKPVTPFQWVGMDSATEIKKKIKVIQSGLKKISNVRLNIENTKNAIIQGLLSRGDRKISDILIAAEKNKENWPKTIKETKCDIKFYVHRERPENEIFPWDFIDHSVKKKFLLREYQKGLNAQTTRPCNTSSCVRCGVC